MDPIGAIITGLRTLAGAIIPPLKKKYFDQPKIYILFNGNGAARLPGLPSSKNDFSKPLKIFTEIRVDKLVWRYNLIFRNNSEHVAYNLNLINPEQNPGFMLEKKIDKLLPLLQNSELVHRAIFETEIEGTGEETHEASKSHPDLLMNNKLILEYTNVKGTKFYTVFDASQEESLRNKF